MTELISFPLRCSLIGFSYLQIGVIQALAGFFNFFVIQGESGFK